ncbi:MAG TPA: flavodoxin [Treponema sp.]|nr:flavodoxin [Treponema sp.]
MTEMHAQNASKKALIVYFSWSGHTQIIAQDIQKATDADIFRLETVKNYPKQYRECTNAAKQELSNNERPVLKSVPDFSKYNTVYLGWPCWWGTMPMAFFTLLEKNNLAGKTIIPFTTHEGSGFGKSLQDLKKLCPDAVILEGFSKNGNSVNDANEDVLKWLKKTGQI